MVKLKAEEKRQAVAENASKDDKNKAVKEKAAEKVTEGNNEEVVRVSSRISE